MNYTTNYHLPQWAETDRIMMEDFNDAMSDIDQGIKTAQSTADTAESKADAAQTTANSVADAYTPGNKPYVVGSYAGTYLASQTITLGFRPSMVIISGEERTKEATGSMLYTVVATSGGPGLVVQLTDTGFTLNSSTDYAPYLNENGRYYRYIAFR